MMPGRFPGEIADSPGWALSELITNTASIADGVLQVGIDIQRIRRIVKARRFRRADVNAEIHVPGQATRDGDRRDAAGSMVIVWLTREATCTW
jgi:hypothetical protein